MYAADAIGVNCRKVSLRRSIRASPRGARISPGKRSFNILFAIVSGSCDHLPKNASAAISGSMGTKRGSALLIIEVTSARSAPRVSRYEVRVSSV